MSKQFNNVSVVTQPNVYFDGKCVSHNILFADGSKKTIGVIFPASLTFGTSAPEVMEMNAGKCRVRMKGEDNWTEYQAGQSFNVPANSSFDIEVLETMDYTCHYG
jgi:uncharacterized protein YaiE (UPF0345 family)